MGIISLYCQHNNIHGRNSQYFTFIMKKIDLIMYLKIMVIYIVYIYEKISKL